MEDGILMSISFFNRNKIKTKDFGMDVNSIIID